MKPLLILSLAFASLAHAAQAPKASRVPEAARRAFVKGNTAFADAKDAEGFLRAAARYQEAVTLAPKWPEPAFNLAKAREAAHDEAGALAAVNAYLKLDLSEADRRQATDWSYALEEKVESRNKEAAQTAALDRFVGTWARSVLGGDRVYHRQAFTVARDGAKLTLGGMMFEGNAPLSVGVRDSALEFKLNWLLLEASGPSVKAVGTYAGALSSDGKRLSFQVSYAPYTAAQAEYWRNWPQGPGNAFGYQDWLKE